MKAPHVIAALALAALAATLITFANNYQLYVVSLVGLTAIVGVGLNVLLGLTGQISLGHAAFYAIGAYVVGIVTTRTPFGFWLAWPLAGVIAGLAGALLAIPALRVRGPYLAMVTIAFGFIIEQGLAEWRGLTGGWNGISGIPAPAIAGWSLAEREILVLVWVATAVTIWLYARLSTGPWGLAMRAVRDSEAASQSIGVEPATIRAVAFAISAACAGLAGGIFAGMSDYISPESFPFFQSILLLLMVMVGGADRVLGPLIGAVVVVLLPELLASLAQYRLLFIGLLLLAVLRLAPEGLAGLWTKFFPPAAAAAPALAADAPVEAHIAPATAQALSASGLSIAFGGIRAVEELSFEALPGRITSIIGPNGAGKSTVLNIACGFYAPDAGSLSLGGRDITALGSHAKARAGIARTFQATQLFSGMSVLDNVLVAHTGGRLRWVDLISPDKTQRAIPAAKALLRLVGYDGPLDRPAGGLAHVDKRLVEIARALAIAPSAILLDEPAAGLDANDSRRLALLLRRLANAGLTVVLVEHDMGLVMSVSDHVVVLDAGRRIAAGTPAEVGRHPAVLKAYLGDGMARSRDRKQELAGGGDELLGVRRLGSGYGAITVLREASLDVRQGELVAVLGANGAGKSTLMRALSGLNRPVMGQILLRDKPIHPLPAHHVAALGLVLVPEGRQVFPELSVDDNIKLGGYARGTQHDEALLEALLTRFPRLRERRLQRAGLLSGGEQQMLAIARGLMARPELLLLDEPSLGLAPKLVEELYDLLAQLRDEGTSILLVDQVATEALSVADRACVLERGEIVRFGAARDLRSDPGMIKAYLGGAEVVSGNVDLARS